MIMVVDAGNTKCEWLLALDDGSLRSLRTKGISPYFNSNVQITGIASGAVAAFDTVRLPRSVYYYGSGCYEKAQKTKVMEALRIVFPKPVSLHVEEDLTGAAIALFGRDEGLAIITGTGSNAGITRQGKIISRINSLGYLLGDEGSGAHIGMKFLKELMNNRLDKKLTENFYGEFRLTPATLLTRLYSAKKPQTYAASLVPFIQRYIHLEEVEHLVETSFGEMVNNMIKPLMAESTAQLPVGVCGGVAAVFHVELRSVFKQHGLMIKKILHAPIEEMAAYHLKK